ncbi:MAG: MTH938/NDUFAF3 family protein [Candidatus Acetothermia bacterium]|jgi:hypothetical protein|nr:MTH938/NDUFAF3 family protein [Candidatus Acetothermia bacterium]MDH7504935.1 Mth938-like domain-containing protein [Candidatus Acetothermia bacterium]
MKIESYHFGEIVIGGKEYRNDVMIYRGQVVGWWRAEGHHLQLRDLNWLLEQEPSPEVIVLGKGRYGLVAVPDEVVQALAGRGIEVLVRNTKDACEAYNELVGSRRVAAALHLTC